MIVSPRSENKFLDRFSVERSSSGRQPKMKGMKKQSVVVPNDEGQARGIARGRRRFEGQEGGENEN